MNDKIRDMTDTQTHINTAMTRLLIITGLLFTLPIRGHTEPKQKVSKLLSARQIRSLQTVLSSKVALLTVTASPRKNISFIKPRRRWAQAYLFDARHVLSSSFIVERSIDEAELSFNVSRLDGTENIDAEVSKVSLKNGWAILTLTRPLKIKSSQDQKSRGIGNESLSGGMQLFAYEPSPRRPALITVEGLSPSPLSFYYYSIAQLQIGTPLFNQNGDLITLVGHVTSRPLGSHLLPKSSIKDALSAFESLSHVK